MTSIAKRMARVPFTLIEYLVEDLRAHFVHLAIATVVGSTWLIAWCESNDSRNHRLVFPAVKKEDVARFVREREGRFGASRGNMQATATIDSTE